MNEPQSNSTRVDPNHVAFSAIGLRAKIALRLLNALKVGELEVVFPDGSTRLYRGSDMALAPAQPEHRAHLAIHDFAALSLAVSRGDIGFGEAYMQGLWTSHNLTALLRLFIANRDAMNAVIYGHWWSTWIDQIRHLLRSNRKSQAKKNISAHYDLGNDFYALWLDPTMTYSSALFDVSANEAHGTDLQAAQERKIDRAIAQLDPKRFDQRSKVLEIGCGWGGLANRLLAQTPCNYKGLTLSNEQQAWAQQTLAPHGPQRFAVALQDYRDEHHRYDGIVSIEMFEAVGERYWNAYFETIARCLKQDGKAVIQTITIDERLFDRYRKNTDFIQQYIFPGGMLPSKQVFVAFAQRHGLAVDDEFCFGHDYAKTLALWARTFDAKRSPMERMGFDGRFQKMWRFYLSYCEAGFAENNIDVVQYTLRLSDSR
jgi:cyclopropane-fatty-acyl-phospholipid synthase